jgi:hypothetical protein
MTGSANPGYTETTPRDFMIDQQLDIPTRDGQTTTFATYRRNLASPAT